MTINMDLVDQLRDMGATIQVNAYSLDEEKSDSVRGWQGGWYWSRK